MFWCLGRQNTVKYGSSKTVFIVITIHLYYNNLTISGQKLPGLRTGTRHLSLLFQEIKRMKTRNILPLLIRAAGDAAATACINKAIKLSAISRHILENESSASLCYHWRFGNIHYTKEGSGKPILLIHDLSPASSGKNLPDVLQRIEPSIPLTCWDLAVQKSRISPTQTIFTSS